METNSRDCSMQVFDLLDAEDATKAGTIKDGFPIFFSWGQNVTTFKLEQKSPGSPGVWVVSPSKRGVFNSLFLGEFCEFCVFFVGFRFHPEF